jgi:muramidase (phage lysozyme)
LSIVIVITIHVEKQNHFAARAGSYQIRNETWKVTLRAILLSHQ